jgi:hypothetical protein
MSLLLAHALSLDPNFDTTDIDRAEKILDALSRYVSEVDVSASSP